MTYPELTSEALSARPLANAAGDADAACPSDRLRTLVEVHYAFVWRSVRRLGVAAADADDAAQQVFLVLSRKLRAVRPGCEPRFLFQTALRVASDYRRAKRRRRDANDGTPLPDPVDPAAGPFDVLALRAERAMLDRVLDAMPLELRAVFILRELDEMTTAEVANVTGLRMGTVASRLRRARAIFVDKATELTGGQNKPQGESR
ncbi:MAG: sigma-70 family RNA polymerase sigma factor [Polyangiaceae bacterium]|nr:sigma-70 family RNA polymerase sigma factor [Polyangiaceae bacterium]